MKSTFSLDELMMFHEVVTAGSLTRASESLGVAKSTLSRRLTRLEKQLGNLLLKRNTRRVVPTEVGLELFERCQRIVSEVASLDTLAEASRNEVTGTLRVSIPSEFGSGWLGKAIAEFALKYPGLALAIDITTRPVNLIEDDYDVAIGFGRLRDSQLAYRRLATLARGIFASPRYLEAHGYPDSLAALQQHEFVVTDVQQREGTLLLREPGTRRRIRLQPRIAVNSMRLARELVLNHVGLAILPRAMCVHHLKSGALVPVLPDWECPTVDASAVVLAREGIPRKTRVFLDFIAQRLEEIEIG